MTEVQRLSLRFQGAAASINDIRAEISAALNELADPASSLAGEASTAGFNSAEFINAESTVDEDAKGFGELVILVMIVAPAATHALNKVWDDVIWPRIRSRLGEDALGETDNSDE